jgi:transmembrane sensor
MKRPSTNSLDTAAIADEAARWLARRDRGLTPAEQDAYMQWLTADPRHAEILAQHAAAFERMMQLYHWQPGQSADANPDLFAPRPLRPWRRWGLSLAAAAALVLGGMLLWREASPIVSPEVPRSYLRVNERRALPDGSVVELKDGSRINLEFSAAERRLHLIGEAHFQVAKNPTPFVVVAGGVALRAVGTAFNVRLDADIVDVLVTEGRVAVATLNSEERGKGPDTGSRTPEAGLPGVGLAEPGAQSLSSVVRRPPSELVAGQRAVVPLTPAAEPRISNVTPAETKEILGWKAPRLQFFETPLAVAVGEFNRHNRTRLVIADRELNAVPIGGTFRADNPEGFVRVLELTLEIKGVPRDGGEIVLTRSR